MSVGRYLLLGIQMVAPDSQIWFSYSIYSDPDEAMGSFVNLQARQVMLPAHDAGLAVHLPVIYSTY